MLSREEILLDNLKEVQLSLRNACQRTGRNPQTVTLLAVTKYACDADVLTLLKTGQITDIAESRVQQALARWKDNPAFRDFPAVRKHFIGHLQKNKAAKAAQFFDFIDALDDFETARILDDHVPDGKIVRALVQVKLTDKQTQSGLPLEKARKLVAQLKHASFAKLRVCGYMAIAPQISPDRLRPLFRSVNEAFEKDFSSSQERWLSLGMSEDFTVAVEEGSTLPRIGSRLFAKNLEEA